MNHLGIDAPTKGVKSLIRRLKQLKTTDYVIDGGAYREEMSISQVLIDTTWAEKELEDWLYKSKGVDFIGTFERTPQ
jgi:hypothetical protein